MYVIGTAGHVDHGKSTLVKTLTGIDPDRWEEEQRREMTIDLGFAWLTLPSGRCVSIVDVPGHERFIKNMLAGVGGIDAALLVIAADESIMPQTEEHLAILDLLEVHHGIIVLTKADLVDDEWLALVSEDVHTRLQHTSLADAPHIAVSARSGQGIERLQATLDAQLDHLPSRAQACGHPRLSIDRAFTIGGFGTVVTGTLLDGPLSIGTEIEITPQRLRARVRGLQTHQRKQDIAFPGTRVAINLAGVSHHDLTRGDMLALPDQIRPTDLLDVRLRLIPDAPQILTQNMRLDLFVGAAVVPCRVTLLDRTELAPGEMGWLQLRLERPIGVSRGDRYIVRHSSPSRTIGGGIVINTHPPRHRRFRPDVISALEALARGTPADLVQQALSDGHLHSWADVQRSSGLSTTLVVEGSTELISAEMIVLLTAAPEHDQPSIPPTALLETAHHSHLWLVSVHGWKSIRDKLVAALRNYHRRYPLRTGMPREELRSRLKLTSDGLDALLAGATAHALIRTSDGSVASADHHPTLNPEQGRIVQRLLDAFSATPYSPPAHDIDPELFGWLIEQRMLVRVSPDIAFPSTAYTEMCHWVNHWITAHGSLTVAQFRDRFGSSRKYALAFLEHLDERKITRRVGDARVLY